MTTDVTQAEREQVFDDWAEAWVSTDKERWLALFTDDVLYEDIAFGTVTQGKAALRAYAASFGGVASAVHMEVTSRVVGGDRGAMEWVLSGTQTGDLPGMPATGKRFRIRGSTVVEFAGSKIKRNADYFDFATLQRQLGFLPEPAPTAR